MVFLKSINVYPRRFRRERDMFVWAAIQIWGVLAVEVALVPRAALGTARTLVHARRDSQGCELRDILDGTEVIHRVLCKVGD